MVCGDIGMHWPLFGASGKPPGLCVWADHPGEARAVQRKDGYRHYRDHPGEKRPPRKITSPRGIPSTCEPRTSMRPDPAYGAATDGFLEIPPREGGNDDCRNHLERFEGKTLPLLRARCGEHDDRVVPQVDTVRAHTEPAKRRPANSHA